MTDMFSNPFVAPETVAPESHSNSLAALVRVVQWSSGGEARIGDDERQDIDEAVENCKPGEYRTLFPMHGGFGALSIGVEGHTLWLYTNGGAFIVGELVNPATVRPRGVPASGTVNISSLPPDQQAAIMTLLNAKRR